MDTFTIRDVRAALKEGMARLRAANVPSHTLATELLLMRALGRDRAWIYAHPEEQLDAAAAAEYFSLVARRAAGEPTQYLTGKQEFWGLEFEVTSAVLIPRPETEHVAEVALDRLGARGIKIDMATGAPSPPLRVADVGTGSGCLAVALAHELPHAAVFATDISGAALEIAKRNAARHGLSERIHFKQTDLLEALLQRSPVPRSRLINSRPRSKKEASGAKACSLLSSTAGLKPRPSESAINEVASSHSPFAFDLIVSNPPYIARDEAATLEREVRDHEPHTALFGGAEGVEIYARLVEQAGSLLRPGGILVLELGYNSADRVRAVLAAEHRWVNISITNDLAGIPRVLAAERA